MVGKTFTYLIGSDAAALLFNSKNENLNAEEVYGKLVTPVFGKGVAYDVPNPVCAWLLLGQNWQISCSYLLYRNKAGYGDVWYIQPTDRILVPTRDMKRSQISVGLLTSNCMF